jgi:phosphate uptake regulator
MDHESKHGVAGAVDITLLGRFYERFFADHTVEVARQGHPPSQGQIPRRRLTDNVPLKLARRRSSAEVCFADRTTFSST